MSDHKPVQVCLTFIDSSPIFNKVDLINNENEFKTITLPPKLENIEICNKFNLILVDQMKEYVNIQSNNSSDKQAMINIMYSQLTNSIKFAYDACSSTTTINELKKKKWFTHELKTIKNKMLALRYKQDKIKMKITN